MPQTKYIYGVINTNKEKTFKPPEAVQTGEINTIPFQDIACVVSDYPESSFNYGTREEMAKKLVGHQAVIEKIMKEHTIIPIKFGTLLENKEEVKKVLEAGYIGFKERLDKFDKKIELDAVAAWNDLNSVIKKIGQEDETIRNFKEEIAKKPPEEAFQEKIKIGSMIKDALDKKRDELQGEMLEFLKDKAEVNCSKKHEIMDDKMIFSFAFLLDEDKESMLDQALNELNNMYNEVINFRCVGPLPPYSFATHEIKKADFEAIDKARKLLDLGEEVNVSEIKEAYRKLAQEKHPDKFPDDHDVQKEFEDIHKAYKLLLDFCRDEKRSLKIEDVMGAYVISILDIGKEP